VTELRRMVEMGNAYKIYVGKFGGIKELVIPTHS
jgi:hypothetical protein